MELDELAKLVNEVLHAAQLLGDVLIVTNAAQGWVEDSARRYLRGAVPVLEEIKVISARALYEHQYEDPHAWKAEELARVRDPPAAAAEAAGWTMQFGHNWARRAGQELAMAVVAEAPLALPHAVEEKRPQPLQLPEVEDSARRYLRGAVPVLEEIKVISARALYEHQYEDPHAWKAEADREVVMAATQRNWQALQYATEDLQRPEARRAGRPRRAYGGLHG